MPPPEPRSGPPGTTRIAARPHDDSAAATAPDIAAILRHNLAQQRRATRYRPAPALAASPLELPLPTYSVADLPPPIVARIHVDPESECWVWLGSVDKRWGHGLYRGEGAYRVVYRLLAGPIRPGLVLDHVKARGCVTNACVWPAHLDPVPPVVNTMRGNSPPAVNARKTCCRHGHPYDDRNTYRPPGRRRRDCRACIRDRVRRYKARERARAERERQAPELLPLAA